MHNNPLLPTLRSHCTVTCFLGPANRLPKPAKCVPVLTSPNVCVVLLISVNAFFAHENPWVGAESLFPWNHGEDSETLSFSGYHRSRKDVLKTAHVFLYTLISWPEFNFSEKFNFSLRAILENSGHSKL